MSTNTPTLDDGGGSDQSRRDFLYLASGTMGAIATAAAAWPVIDSLNPAEDVLAFATIEADLSPIEKGMAISVMWRGKPVFLRRRTEAEVEQARTVDMNALPDPEPDTERVKQSEWLIVIGVCTHLGCIPQGNKPTEPRGDYGGWFCTCHGSHYDTSGRVRKGPAPKNLHIPPYRFTEAQTVEIG
jgi:ubiquinol-cytochrome c reductase iron-sulfur subunit